ncbi:MAG: UbiD family decarboxylase [Candidatus Bathyarchaeia archaeon]
MPYNDLREFLGILEKEGELIKIKAEVDPRFELSAICRKATDAKSPALLFEKIKGYNAPILANLIATRRRFALALETTEEEVTKKWINALRKGPTEPVVVKDGPCKENILIGDEIDLMKLPWAIPYWNEKDGGPYITAPCVISKDPETGWRNVGIYRMMVRGKRTTGFQLTPFRHMYIQKSKAEAKGNRFPVAVAIGADPVIWICAAAPFAYEVDEIAMAGTLRGQPIELVKCETIPLEVPATAEIVLEGEVIPNLYENEGPFGEFHGYYGGIYPREVFEIKAVTYRDNPIYHVSFTGVGTENHILFSMSLQAEIIRTCPMPGLQNINILEDGVSMIAVAQVEKRFEGIVNWIASAILGCEAARMIKYLIVVDEDIDPFDLKQVMWAVATRTQPHRDIFILPNTPGTSLDPSIDSAFNRKHGLISKMVIDATKKPMEAFPEVPDVPMEIKKMVEKKWVEYGIGT